MYVHCTRQIVLKLTETSDAPIVSMWTLSGPPYIVAVYYRLICTCMMHQIPGDRYFHIGRIK